jgi:membrane-bound metal-dependent hydrolase YbcI (DUF457 family)
VAPAALTAAVFASHVVLDTMTDGGLGCALLWPFSNRRYFAPWNPIPVAPIGKAFFSRRGLSVAMVELLLFTPFLVYVLWPRRKASSDASDEKAPDSGPRGSAPVEGKRPAWSGGLPPGRTVLMCCHELRRRP